VTGHPLAGGLKLTVVEPPSGSNLCLIRTGAGLLCFDSGFPCYGGESLDCLRGLYSGFDSLPRDLLLTHADVDHVGLAGSFDRVFLSRKCYDNFVCESRGQPNLREQNPAHAPYVRISKILSHYKPPELEKMRIIGGDSAPCRQPVEAIGALELGGLTFEVYEGAGGHIAGEVVYIERRLRVLFTGDLFVNIKGFMPQQAQFNRVAPYLMTSVDTDPALAAGERQAILKLLDPGPWLLVGGHGAPMTVTAG